MRFALDVGLDLGPHLVQVAVGDPERFGELGVERGQPRLLHLVHLQRERGGLARHLLALIVLREGQLESLALAGRHAARGRLERRQGAAFAEQEAEAGRLAAFERHAVDLALEVDRHAVAVLRGARHGVELGALLAQDLERAIDRGVVDRHLRPLDRRAADVARLELRIDLEGRAELERLVVAAVVLLDLRVARHAQVLLLDRVAERLLHRVAQHFAADLGPVLLRHQLHRHLAGTEARHLDVARELLQPLVDLALDLLDRHRHRKAPLERAQGFQICRHAYRFLVVVPPVARLVPLVRRVGLEPTSVSALEPKSSASTNSATFALQRAPQKRSIILWKTCLPSARAARFPFKNQPVSIEHYENFPVASLLLPAAERAPVGVIYRFARSADDFADEGELAPAERLARLDAYRAELRRIARGETPREPLFADLARVVREPRPAARAAARPAGRLLAGRGQAALRRLRRAARVLPPLGQSGRPPAAAPVPRRDERERRALGRGVHRAAAGEFLAGCGDRPRKGADLPAAGRDGALRRERTSRSPKAAATTPGAR